jgi:hypothetical protein
LVEQITGDEKIQGTVWVWTPQQTYVAVPLNDLRQNPDEYEEYQKEIAPMQTFILKQTSETGDNASTEINYASAIWGNPRYSSIPGTPAPVRREASASDHTSMRIVITAANGQSDAVRFLEAEKYSDTFEDGYDASKYMNVGTINAYISQNGEDLSVVATDNIEGKKISLKTNDEIAYTLSFKNVKGEPYAIRDEVTGSVIAIEEGQTYEFAAPPNSVAATRFSIVGVHKLPTSVETTEVKSNVKGIYTILGQYVGEDFRALPAGMYIVDGVKIVK